MRILTTLRTIKNCPTLEPISTLLLLAGALNNGLSPVKANNANFMEALDSTYNPNNVNTPNKAITLIFTPDNIN